MARNLGRKAQPIGRRSHRSTAILIGRDEELRRLTAALGAVPVAVIFGVAGVGKSTLALEYASRFAGPVAYVKLGGQETVAEISEAIHRQLAATHYDVAVSDEERLEDLCELVERAGALAVVDDVHFLAAPVRTLLVDTGARILRGGRLIAISRELIPVAAGAPDRLQLRLEALDREQARRLWERLAELYGPGRDFETAWRRSRGNPFLLRQAHVGTLAAAQPLESALRSLGGDELRLAGALASSHIALPADVIARLLPPPRAERALDALQTRLIADVTPDERYLVHDLFRKIILRDLDGATAAAIARDLVSALEASSLDAVTCVQETARHLRLLGDHARIGGLLLANGVALVRQGAAATLLQELDMLPAAAMTPELVVLRARTLVRGMQIRRAYEELKLLMGGSGAPRHRFYLATFAAVCGDIDDAQPILEELLGDPALEPELRLLCKIGLAWTLAHRGRNAEARRALDDPDVRASPPLWRSSPLRLYLFALEEERDRAADLALEILAGLRGRPPDLWSRLITPVMCAVTLADAGHLDAADEALAWMAQSLHRPEDCLELAWTRMTIAAERGERLRPLAYFQGIQRVLDRGGHFVGAVFTRMLSAKLLFGLGRRTDGLAVIAELTRQCRERNAGGFERLIARAAAEDPLAPGWLAEDAAAPPAKRAEHVRAGLRAALRCARVGRSTSLPRVEIPPEPDYAFDRALLELAHAVLARRKGQERVAAQRLQRAIAEAAAGGADEGLIEEIERSLPEPSPLAEAKAGPPPLVIDRDRHEIHAGAHRLSLASRAVLRRLIYAFVAAPGQHLSRDEIAGALWNTEYDPLRHESSLKSSIRRLRSLLAGTGVLLQSDEDGYRLVLPRGAVVVPPPPL